MMQPSGDTLHRYRQKFTAVCYNVLFGAYPFYLYLSKYQGKVKFKRFCLWNLMYFGSTTASVAGPALLWWRTKRGLSLLWWKRKGL